MAVRSQIILFLLFAKSSVMCLYELQTKWKEKILRVIHPNKNHKIRSALLHPLPQSRSPRPTPLRRTGRGSSRVPWRAPSGKDSGISPTASLGVEKGRAASFSLGTGSLGLHSQDPALLQEGTWEPSFWASRCLSQVWSQALERAALARHSSLWSSSAA